MHRWNGAASSHTKIVFQKGGDSSYFNGWESELSVPDIDKIISLSDYFEVSTDYLLKGVETFKLMSKKTKNYFIFSFVILFALLSGILSFAASRFRNIEIFMISIAGAVIGLAVGSVLFTIIKVLKERT